MADVTIRTAIEKILSGSIRIPAFQRGFVWSSENVSFLMDSIYRKYPIGSVLLWRTSTRLEKERDLGPFTLAEPEKDYPVDYVLDGQQRLTSIFSVFQNTLKPNSSTEQFAIYFDLEAPDGALEDQFLNIIEGEVDESRYFPLRSIFDAGDFFSKANNLNEDNKNKAIELQRRFQEFQIPLEIIEFDNKEEIAIIFERINRAGIQLDAFQLLSAWTWSSEFDLNEAMAELEAELSPFGFSDLAGDPNLIMKCCAAVVVGDAQLKNVVNLHGPTVREQFDIIRNGITGAIDFLKRNLNVENLKVMPYPAMIVPLSAFFATDKAFGVNPNIEQLSNLVKWYWRSCISRRYSSGVGRAHSVDITYMQKLKEDSSSQPLPSTRALDLTYFLENKFSMSNVNSKILINILSQRKPLNLLSGSPIDVKKVLQLGNRNEFHHIFPRAHLKRLDYEDHNINCLANICFLSKHDNNKIKDNAPEEYAKSMNKEKFDLITDSNAIPGDFFKITFDEFKSKRADILAQYANELADVGQ